MLRVNQRMNQKMNPSLFSLWAVRELGISGTFLAKWFRVSQPGVVYAVNKGEKIAKEKNYPLLEQFTYLPMDVLLYRWGKGWKHLLK